MKGCRCNSLAEHLPSICRTLGSISSMAKNKNKRYVVVFKKISFQVIQFSELILVHSCIYQTKWPLSFPALSILSWPARIPGARDCIRDIACRQLTDPSINEQICLLNLTYTQCFLSFEVLVVYLCYLCNSGSPLGLQIWESLFEFL